MASGKKNNVNKANQATKNAVNASKPKNYSDPYGKFSNGVYTPNLNSDQISTRDNTLGKIDSIVAWMPTELSANDLFNNDFYQPLNNMYKGAIDSQYEKDKRELDNQLNARNQIGGSYDALKNYYMNKDYGSRYQNAQSQSRLGAADAWTQAFQNSVAGLGALRGDAMNAQNMAYQPMQMYLGYQGAVSPLQQTSANAYMNQASQYWAKPTLFDNVMRFTEATAGIAAAAAGKAAAGGA